MSKGLLLAGNAGHTALPRTARSEDISLSEDAELTYFTCIRGNYRN